MIYGKRNSAFVYYQFKVTVDGTLRRVAPACSEGTVENHESNIFANGIPYAWSNYESYIKCSSVEF